MMEFCLLVGNITLIKPVINNCMVSQFIVILKIVSPPGPEVIKLFSCTAQLPKLVEMPKPVIYPAHNV